MHFVFRAITDGHLHRPISLQWLPECCEVQNFAFLPISHLVIDAWGQHARAQVIANTAARASSFHRWASLHQLLSPWWRPACCKIQYLRARTRFSSTLGTSTHCSEPCTALFPVSNHHRCAGFWWRVSSCRLTVCCSIEEPTLPLVLSSSFGANTRSAKKHAKYIMSLPLPASLDKPPTAVISLAARKKSHIGCHWAKGGKHKI